MTFGSLFAGIGGLDLGLERAGMECRWQVEIDDYAQRVLAKHWPDVRRHGDIRTWPDGDAERVDLICGGFPCQDISYAGQGAGLSGERSGLFYELIRVVREMEPRFVLLENVAALLTRGLDDVLGTLASLGFDAEWHCIPAAYVGAPHIRDRIFVIGSQQRKRDRKQRGQSGPAVAGDDGEATDSEGERRRAGRAGRVVGVGPREEDPAEVADAGRKHGDEGRSEPRTNQSSQIIHDQRCGHPECGDAWSVEPAVGRVANGVPARVDRLRGLGNAVVPQVAEFIGRQIMAAATV
jgi:DNA (cytosine-5)-methyltransferase 1